MKNFIATLGAMVLVFLLIVVVGNTAMGYARSLGREDALARQDKAMIYSQSRSLPDVVLVKKAMPNDGQVCAEPPSGGIVACKSVAEFRAWVREPGVKGK
jgi:hypothetical protein